MQQTPDRTPTENGPLNTSILISGPTTLAYLDSYPSGCATPSCAAVPQASCRARLIHHDYNIFQQNVWSQNSFRHNPFRLATLGKLRLA